MPLIISPALFFPRIRIVGCTWTSAGLAILYLGGTLLLWLLKPALVSASKYIKKKAIRYLVFISVSAFQLNKVSRIFVLGIRLSMAAVCLGAMGDWVTWTTWPPVILYLAAPSFWVTEARWLHLIVSLYILSAFREGLIHKNHQFIKSKWTWRIWLSHLVRFT